MKRKENVGVLLVNSFTWRKAKKLVREQRPRMRPAERLQVSISLILLQSITLYSVFIKDFRYNDLSIKNFPKCHSAGSQYLFWNINTAFSNDKYLSKFAHVQTYKYSLIVYVQYKNNRVSYILFQAETSYDSIQGFGSKT